MIKLILCVAVVALSGFAGYFAAIYYRKRKRFFADYVDFLNHAKTEISFFQNRLNNVFDSFDAQNSDFEKVLKQYSKNLLSSNELPQKPIYIKQAEWQYFIEFLHSMGRSDVERECGNIEANIQKAKLMMDDADTEYRKKFGLCIKMGICVGFAIAIIII